MRELRFLLAGLVIAFAAHADDRSIGCCQTFKTLNSVFRFIATHEGLKNDIDTVVALATYSKVERVTWDETGALVLIEAQYYGASNYRFGIRGAGNNGLLYVLRETAGHFELVNALQASSYKWDVGGAEVRILTSWHVGAQAEDPTIYGWNGRSFVNTSTVERAEPRGAANAASSRR